MIFWKWLFTVQIMLAYCKWRLDGKDARDFPWP